MEIIKQCRQSVGGKLNKHKAEKLFSSFLAVFLSSCVTTSDRGETMTGGGEGGRDLLRACSDGEEGGGGAEVSR